MRRKKFFYFGFFFVLLCIVCIILLPYFPQIRNKFFMSFLPPKAYMAILEKEYIKERSKEWELAAQNASQHLAQSSVSSVSLEAEINNLVAKIFQDKLPFSFASLDFCWDSFDSSSLLQTVFCAKNQKLRMLELTRDRNAQTILMACPELSDAAIAFSTDSKEPFVQLLQHLYNILDAFFQSVSNAVIRSPYQYLLPFLNVLQKVNLEKNYPLILDDKTIKTTKMQAFLSLDTALFTASEQLQKIQSHQELPDPVFACYNFCIFLLDEIASRYPADLSVTAYADSNGKILCHEFKLLSGEELLFSLSNMLFTDRTSNLSGTVSVTIPKKDSENQILFEVEQLGFDAVTGYPTGKISFTIPKQPLLYWQVFLTAQNNLPVVRLHIRAAGITAASIALFPAQKKPEGNIPPSYRKIYKASEWRDALKELDFETFSDRFYKEFGIRLTPAYSF